MNKRIIFIVFIIAVIFIAVKVIPLLGSDAEKIRKVIHAAKSATEKENILKCISFISIDYDDKHGNYRGSFFLICKNVFREYNDIFIIIEDLNIEITEDSNAVARIIASGQGRRTGEKTLRYLFDTDRVEFDVHFKKEGNDWKIVELDFIEPEDFMQFLKGL